MEEPTQISESTLNGSSEAKSASSAQNARCVTIPHGLKSMLAHISQEILYNSPKNVPLYLAEYFEDRLSQRNENYAQKNDVPKANQPLGFLNQLMEAKDGKQIPFDSNAKKVAREQCKKSDSRQTEETKSGLAKQKSYFVMPCRGDKKSSSQRRILMRDDNENANLGKIHNVTRQNASALTANANKSLQLECGDNGGHGENQLDLVKIPSHESFASEGTQDLCQYASVQVQCDLDPFSSQDEFSCTHDQKQQQPSSILRGLNMTIDMQNLLPRNYFQIPFLRKAPGMCIWWPTD